MALESQTPSAITRSVPCGIRRSGTIGLAAATHTRPVTAPIAAGTHGPRAYGALDVAARRLRSHTVATSVTAIRPPVSIGRTVEAITATASHTTMARPLAASSGRLSRAVLDALGTLTGIPRLLRAPCSSARRRHATCPPAWP